MGRGVGSADHDSAVVARSSWAIDPGSGFIEEWRQIAAIEQALDEGNPVDVLLDTVMSSTELEKVAQALLLAVDDDELERIRALTRRRLAEAPLNVASAQGLLRSTRILARAAAANELAALAAVDGPKRAQKLAQTTFDGRQVTRVLSSQQWWERLLGENWTLLPIFRSDDFRAYARRTLPQRRRRLLSVLDAVARIDPGGGAGGDEALAVLNTTTAASS